MSPCTKSYFSLALAFSISSILLVLPLLDSVQYHRHVSLQNFGWGFAYWNFNEFNTIPYNKYNTVLKKNTHGKKYSVKRKFLNIQDYTNSGSSSSLNFQRDQIQYLITSTSTKSYLKKIHFPSSRNTKLDVSSSSNSDGKSTIKFDYKIDYYAVLKIDSNASKEEIKRSYRRLALKTHPDTAGNSDEEKEKKSLDFIRINQAYEVLSDEQTRAKYDKARKLFEMYGSPSSSNKSTSNRYNSDFKSRSGSTSSKSYADYFNDYTTKQKDYEDAYDTGGDSFGKIFSDFWKSINEDEGESENDFDYDGKGVVEDFVDFLERKTYRNSAKRESKNKKDEKSVSSSTTSRANASRSRTKSSFIDDIYTDDDDLLYNGTLEELLLEIENTQYLIQRLKEKATLFKGELLQAELKVKEVTQGEKDNKKSYSDVIEERINAEEKVAGLKAKIDNIDKYINTSKKRLDKLEKRHKERDASAAKGTRPRSSDATDTTSNTQRKDYSSNSSRSYNNNMKNDDNTKAKSPSFDNYNNRPNEEKANQTKQIKNLSSKDALQKLKVDEELDKLKKKMGLK